MAQKRSKYVIRHLRHKKLQYVQLLGGKCIKCGYYKNLAALEFHHKNEKKTGENWRDPNFNPEDCELLCSNHHREEHFPQLNDFQDETNILLSQKIKQGLDKRKALLSVVESVDNMEIV